VQRPPRTATPRATRRGLVTADAAGEEVQVRQVVPFDGDDPLRQALAVAAGHHLGEGGDVALSCGLRALIRFSWAVSSWVR
jgi:hypothetical protein